MNEAEKKVIEKNYNTLQCPLDIGQACIGHGCWAFKRKGVYCHTLQVAHARQQLALEKEVTEAIEEKRKSYKYYYHITWLVVACLNLGLYAYRLRFYGVEILGHLDYISIAATIIIGIYQYSQAQVVYLCR